MPPKVNSDMKSIIKETIKELLSDEEFLNKILSKVAEKLENFEKTLIKANEKIKQLEGQIDNLQQNEKINNICVYGIEEEENEKVPEKILKLLNEKVKVSVKREDIVKCYRIGNKTEKIRPIVVKLDQYNLKYRILKNSGYLKGSKMGISEDLIKSKLNLLKKAQEAFDRKSVYTRYGNIYIKRENITRKIRNTNEIQQLIN